ncbi:hypothetical protein QZH46_27850 [Pseudomonas corrugata]
MLQDSEHGIDRASVSGFEYTWVSAFNGASDLSLLYEHLTDTRCDSVIASCGEMLGIRWIANDVADTNLLVSSVRDRQNGLWGLKVQGSRRIDEQLSLLLNSGGCTEQGTCPLGYPMRFDHAGSSFLALPCFTRGNDTTGWFSGHEASLNAFCSIAHCIQRYE